MDSMNIQQNTGQVQPTTAQVNTQTQQQYQQPTPIRRGPSGSNFSLSDVFHGGSLKFMVGLVVLFVVFMFSSRVFFKTASLTIIGEGKLDFPPQEASMIVTKVNEASDAIAAIDQGDEGIKRLIEIAKTTGGQNTKIKKAFYQIQPTVTSQGKMYQVVNAFSVTFPNVTQTSEMIKLFYESGAATVTGVSFDSADKAKTEQEVRKLAVKDAKEQAKQVAKAAGKRLGRIVAISDDNQDVSSAVANDSGNDSTNSVSVIKRVSIVFEIW